MRAPWSPSDLDALVASGGPVLADGGIETYITFETSYEMSALETTGMLDDPEGRRVLRDLYGAYLEVARRHGLPAVLGTPTWRGGADRLAAAGRPPTDLVRLNREGVVVQRALVDEHMAAWRRDQGSDEWFALVAGVLAPRGDGYDPSGALTVDDAERYHHEQAAVLAEAGADLLFAVPLPAADEAVGLGRAMAATGTPWVPSFLVGRDGRLPDGSRLVDVVDRLHHDVPVAPVYVSISCVHPTVALAAHQATSATSAERAAWDAVRELKANGSDLPPGVLDGSHHLVCDPPEVWADAMLRARRELGLTVVGGCCGTDPGHLAALAVLLTDAD